MDTETSDGKFDPASLVERVDNDPELFHDILDTFIKGYASKMIKLRESVTSLCSKDLNETAHSFKSELLILGHKKSAELAKELEDIGRSGSINPEYTMALLSKLEKENQPILEFIKNRPDKQTLP